MSSSVCLGGLVLFTVTGITLNHAADISSTPSVIRTVATAPEPLLATLGPSDDEAEAQRSLPAGLANWLSEEFGIELQEAGAEWSEEEIYISLPRPGGDAWISVDRTTGEAELEKSDRGWVAYLNDLHKGRHTGPAWAIFIDVLALACLVFVVTGVILLQIHGAKRPATWPAVAFGFLAPVVILLMFVHR